MGGTPNLGTILMYSTMHFDSASPTEIQWDFGHWSHAGRCPDKCVFVTKNARSGSLSTWPRPTYAISASLIPHATQSRNSSRDPTRKRNGHDN
jgi:hypothetical protein